MLRESQGWKAAVEEGLLSLVFGALLEWRGRRQRECTDQSFAYVSDHERVLPIQLTFRILAAKSHAEMLRECSARLPWRHHCPSHLDNGSADRSIFA